MRGVCGEDRRRRGERHGQQGRQTAGAGDWDQRKMGARVGDAVEQKGDDGTIQKGEREQRLEEWVDGQWPRNAVLLRR
ncbi:hypothetical protein BU14_0234s0043 [Porphyra umbilicalis]|uniref:Uncharacterized protein n=1 Tax=Porphyra umbilicalis TaxID=2786 RepID=A0A1X6P415_PORUM|nr:hypothetical protein BU14_0234s0043 [Porphyra umbilicalis]|eukprot:OSX75516.1 hypothetical protein BU14_0234s0043 [Porphyra umbilicalis]